MYYGMYQDLARTRTEQRLHRRRGVRRGAIQINQQVRLAARKGDVR